MGINIKNFSYKNILEIIETSIINFSKLCIFYANQYIVLESFKNEDFKKCFIDFDNIYCDGIGVYLASKFLYGKNGLKNRLTGTDLYYKILNVANEKRYRIFFFGGADESVKNLPIVINEKYSNIRISGILSRETNYEKAIELINMTITDILFVGLGTPLQEFWIHKNKDLIKAPVIISVGSGIDFIAETKKRSPEFMRFIGLEWLYRMYLEPKRLWKRYLVGIPFFVFKILIFKFKLKKCGYNFINSQSKK